MNLINTPLTLGDIFEKLFNLFKNTVYRNLIISLIIIAPVGLVFAWGMDSFFSQMKDTSYYGSGGGEFNPRALSWVFQAMGIYTLSITVFMIGYLAATLGVTIVSCSEVEGKQISWQEAFNQTFSVKLLRLFGLSILEVLIMGGIFIIPVIIISIGTALNSGIAIFFGVILILAAAVIVVYLAVSWTFTIPALGWENLGIIDSFKRSFNLVSNNWWRTLGLIVLLGIIIEFALSIITTPISLVIFWDMFVELFELIGSGVRGIDPEDLFKNIFASFGERFGIVIVLSTTLKLLIQPLLYVVLYYDLRARKGEFSPDEPEDNSINLDNTSFESLND